MQHPLAQYSLEPNYTCSRDAFLVVPEMAPSQSVRRHWQAVAAVLHGYRSLEHMPPVLEQAPLRREMVLEQQQQQEQVLVAVAPQRKQGTDLEREVEEPQVAVEGERVVLRMDQTTRGSQQRELVPVKPTEMQVEQLGLTLVAGGLQRDPQQSAEQPMDPQGLPRQVPGVEPTVMLELAVQLQGHLRRDWPVDQLAPLHSAERGQVDTLAPAVAVGPQMAETRTDQLRVLEQLALWLVDCPQVLECMDQTGFQPAAGEQEPQRLVEEQHRKDCPVVAPWL